MKGCPGITRSLRSGVGSFGFCVFAVAMVLGPHLGAIGGRAACAAPSRLHTLGTGADAFYINEHANGLVSVFIQAVPLDSVLDELKAIGGPTYSSLVPLTRPITLSLHQVTWQTVLDRMFTLLNATFHYRDGHPSHVRVLRMAPNRNYKAAPRPTESKAEWFAIERVAQ